MLVYSFAQRGTLGGVVLDFTLENYAGVLDPVYLQIVIRSIVYAAITTAICLAAGYPVAYLIGRADERWRNLLLMAVMVPFWTSFLIRTYAWVTILKSEGLLNSLLLQLQLIAEPLEMLYTPGAVVLGLVYTFLPFMILPIYSSVEKLDGALIEAALDLGAGPAARVLARDRAAHLARHRRRRAARVRAGARHLRRERHPGRRPRRHDRQHHREPVQGQRAQLAVRRRARHHAAGELRGDLLLREPPPARGRDPLRASEAAQCVTMSW